MTGAAPAASMTAARPGILWIGTQAGPQTKPGYLLDLAQQIAM